uniref:Programmed cell death protein 6 n=1 Tax=Aceria tosichella TaxID=561515 RepID=A0A6G1SDD7_9ACAR
MAAPPVQADEGFLRKIFQQVDKDRSNAINATELQACLSNGTWEPFNAETIKLMITMFDRSHKGQLNYEEFKQLWKYIEDWRQCFLSFDKDKSGYINKEELKLALTTFGYQLSDTFYDLLLVKFVKGGQVGRIYFDDFIQICVSLQTITAAFRHHDTDSDGVITIKYEDFLKLIFSLR